MIVVIGMIFFSISILYLQAAIIAQMIQTVYLIFPTWTANVSQALDASIGIFQQEGLSKRQLCMCFIMGDKYCVVKASLKSNSEQIIPVKSCPGLWNFTQIELLSSDASSVLRYSKKYALPLNSTAPLILDIDEDFFGVHLVGHELLKVKLSMDESLEIDDVIRGMICLHSGTSKNEMLADVWFRSHLIELQQNCASNYCLVHPFYNQTLTVGCQAALHRSKQRLLKIPEILCGSMSETEYKFNSFSQIMLNLMPEQLESLKQVGICLEEAWKTFSIDSQQQQINLCLGHNRPGQSIVPEHVPEFRELRQLVKNFTRILRALPKKPAVITVARSARDGYVARWLQPLVESLIIKAAKLVFGLENEDIHYSNYLAGGHSGWHNRFH